MLFEKFTELWESTTGTPVDKNNLCGVYYEQPDGRVEIIWRPEQPTSSTEQCARNLFRIALVDISKSVDSKTDGLDNQEFCMIDPTIGHVALRVFCDHTRVVREISQMATMRPYISEDYIG